MIAYKRTVTIKDPRELVLNDLPFQTGQRVEVVMLAEETTPIATIGDLQALLLETQALPQARAVTDEEIAAEIKAYRAGRREGTD